MVIIMLQVQLQQHKAQEIKGDTKRFCNIDRSKSSNETNENVFNEYDDKETENSGGGVWEWIDVSVSSDVLPFLRDFSNSKNAKMRLSGKYTRTRNLTWNERQGIRDVLNGYDAIKQGIK